MEIQVAAASSGDARALPTPRSPPAAPVKAQCEDCGASFSRREHLQRHKRSHTNERPYACSQCGNAFARMDVLTKHLESHSQQALTSSRTSKLFPRACTECAQIRIRCSRGLPCRRCSDRGLKCIYPASRKRKASGITLDPVSDAVAAAESSLGALDESDDVVDPSIGRAAEEVQAEESTLPSTAVPPADACDGNVEPSWEMDRDSSLPGQPLQAVGIQTHSSGDGMIETPDDSQVIQAVDWFAVNWLSPTAAGSSAFDQNDVGVRNLQQSEGAYALFDYAFPSTFAPGAQWTWPPPAPIFDRSAPALNLSTERGRPAEEECSDSRPGTQFDAEGVDESMASVATPATLYVDGGASRAPFKGLSAQRGVNTHEEDSDSGSLEDTYARTEQSSRGHLSPRASENVLDGIRTTVSIDQLRGGCFPTHHQLQTFFRLYFRYFHPPFPFLQSDSGFYDDGRCWPLALAVCATGAQYCTRPDSVLTRDFLVEVLQQVVAVHFDGVLERGHETSFASHSVPDNQAALHLWVTQTAVLSFVCQNFTPQDHRFPTHSSSIKRFKLVQACRSLGLLKRPSTAVPSHVSHASPDHLGSQMGYWMWQQSRLRTGYMIWLLDSLMTIENPSEALMSLGDINCPLPCRDHAWEHPTVPVVARECSHAVDFLDAMEMLYIEKKLPKGLGDFGTIIMIHVIIQRTKAVVKQYQTGLASWVPSASSQKRAPSRRVEETWPPCLPILSKWRNSACDCLDVLHWNANSISARDGGWETFTILHLHLSRLVLLTPMEPLRVLASESPSQLPDGGPGSEVMQLARRKVLKWALEDQYKARLAVIHAGALFWHVRRYSINSFVEPVGIYLATLALWGYSMASASNIQAEVPVEAPSRGQTAETDVRSDERSMGSINPPPQDNSSCRLSPLSGLDEDPEVMQFYVDRPCDDEIVQAYVRYGRRMSGRLSQVGDLCHKDAPGKILVQGQRILEARQRGGRQHSGDERPDSSSGPSGNPIVWGISARYLRTLREFAKRELGCRA